MSVQLFIKKISHKEYEEFCDNFKKKQDSWLNNTKYE